MSEGLNPVVPYQPNKQYWALVGALFNVYLTESPHELPWRRTPEENRERKELQSLLP